MAMKQVARLAVLAAFLILAPGAHAVQPDEVLADKKLETRARALSAGLRCLVCQNQSIDDSDADLARTLRIVLRERLVAGDSDRQVLDYMTARFGEFVLLKPRFAAHNLVLWLAPFGLLLIGAITIVASRRRARSASGAEQSLSAEEEKRLAGLLDKPADNS